MADKAKDTIYIDVDDEITAIIDKLRTSSNKVVALVLPKRATTLQSIVNMKLLKRSAEEAKKSLVLITSEKGLMPLAGAVGLHVAKTLQSKPAIPPPPDQPDSSEVVQAEDTDSEEEIPLDRTKSIGELAGVTAAADAAEETIEVDPEETTETPAAAKKLKKDRKLRVPNFESFRLRLILAIAAVVLLIVFWLFGTIILPKARVTVKTDASSVNANLSLNLSTAAKSLDQDKLIVPATLQETKKSDSETVPATGQKDNGTKATGTVTIYNCNKDDTLSGTTHTVPAGTGVTTNGLTFITQASVDVGPSHFSGNSCRFDAPSNPVSVTAQSNGDKYNLSARNQAYTVANFPSMTADGSAMTGGTSQIIKVVSGADIEAAKAKLKDRSTPTATTELKQALSAQHLQPINESLTASDPTITNTPNVGDQADQVSVTQVVTYDILGVKSDDLKTLVEANVRKQIDTSKQTIIDNGLDKAIYQLVDRKSPSDLTISLQAIASAGPELNADFLKHQIAGKKKGDAVTIIQNRPGIKDVTIDYSPFWVTTTPKRASRITIVFEKPPNNASQKP